MPSNRSASPYKDVGDTIPALCWLADATGSIYWYNAKWFEYTGTLTKDMEGWGWQSVHHPKTLDLVLARWRDCLSTGRPFSMIFPLRAKNGDYRPFLTKATPILEKGTITGWFGINVEISDTHDEHCLEEWSTLLSIMEG